MQVIATVETDWIIAVCTAGVLLFNAVYVLLTHRMLKAQVAPCVIVYTDPSNRGVPYVDLVVENVGNGVAYDVRLSSDRQLPERAVNTSGVLDAAAFMTGIAAIGPRQQRRFLFGEYHALNDAIGEEPICVTAVFSHLQDDEWQRLDTRNPIEVRSWEAVLVPRPPLGEIADAVKKIGKSIDKIAAKVA